MYFVDKNIHFVVVSFETLQETDTKTILDMQEIIDILGGICVGKGEERSVGRDCLHSMI